MKYFYIKDPGAGERQSSGLLLFVTSEGKMIGICDEYDSATYDIALIVDPKTAGEVSWFSWDHSLDATPASWNDILKSGFVNLLTGILNFNDQDRRVDYIVFSEIGADR